jgi:hypothetical protein
MFLVEEVWYIFGRCSGVPHRRTRSAFAQSASCLFCYDGVRPCLCRTADANGPIVHPTDDIWMWSNCGITMTGENRRTWRKTCPSATLSTTNPTWAALGANSALHGEKPVTNHLSYGTAPHYLTDTECILALFCTLHKICTKRNKHYNLEPLKKKKTSEQKRNKTYYHKICRATDDDD